MRYFIATLALAALSGYAADENFRVYISGYSPTVTCFTLDLKAGTLKELSKSDGGKNPSFMAWHPNRKFMYSANEVGEGRVTAYAINSENGALTRLNDASSAGNGVCHVSVHASGKWVFAANYGSGTIGVLPIKDDGSVGEPVQKLAPGKNAHMIITDPAGKFVFNPCLGSNLVAQFVFDEATGQLKENTPASVTQPAGAGPRHIGFSPNAKFAYVINELGLTMTSFKYDAAKGLLTEPETVPTVPEGTDRKGKSTAHVLVHPSGKFVYGSNRGFDTIVIYAADEASGRLTLVGQENGGGDIKVPRNFTIDPTGAYLIAANQKGDSVTVFRIDQASGKLEKTQTLPVAPGPSFVGVLPVK